MAPDIIKQMPSEAEKKKPNGHRASRLDRLFRNWQIVEQPISNHLYFTLVTYRQNQATVKHDGQGTYIVPLQKGRILQAQIWPAAKSGWWSRKRARC